MTTKLLLLDTRGSLMVNFCCNAYWCEFFTRAVCLEEGYNIVAAHTQKPIPLPKNHCSQIVVKT